jgi:hypothetical protein
MQPTSNKHQSKLPTPRAWYGARISEFLDSDSDEVVKTLVINSDFPVLPTQRQAWVGQLDLLKRSVIGWEGGIFLEFSIPRMGRRIDTVLLVGSVCLVVEFKVGEDAFNREDVEQAWDYALDLKNFHEASHRISIVPILVATEADINAPDVLVADHDEVYRPVCVGGPQLRQVIDLALRTIPGPDLDLERWPIASYKPTPTIIESARALYAQHSVDAIARNDAGAQNLAVTSGKIDDLVDDAIAKSRKVICFVTGVPGAGKTLVGLNVATRHRRELEKPTHAVYLSGNGPLVKVLHEALTRDEVQRRKSLGEKVRKGEVGSKVKAFIQNVHHFRDEALIDTGAPFDHVVIFDEAQRAWNLEQTASFMLRRKKRPGFDMSEPEFLISYMDRHKDWAVIVCLVGGGQEINRGEAGIDSWLEAINSRYPHWDAYISSRLTDSEYASGYAVTRAQQRQNVYFDNDLHLSVSMRSFRAENVSSFVKALLDNEKELARMHFSELIKRYPVVITRDLKKAKEWTRKQARGSERYGLLASSKAQRLKPHSIDVRVSVDPVHWFLNDRDDTRSSYYLEDAATEFQAQGLELDWACVTWDGDLRYSEAGWGCHEFRGNRWCNIRKEEKQVYLLNSYRVLLTRARQGMAIFVPKGDSEDPTRSPEFYDSTFRYLTDVGIPHLEH